MPLPCAPSSTTCGCKVAKVAEGGGQVGRDRHTGTRQAAAARPRADAAGPRHALPGAGASGRAQHVQQRRAGRRHRGGHRPRQRRGLHDRVQRRHRQRRHLLPDDGQEAPAGAGDRAAEPPALHLPGGLGRCQPAQPGRGLPRPRPLRPHLLQPGQHERAGHCADRGGHGLVHGRRRLCAGDERRDHHREEPGHHLPGRPAAGEGRHRRGGQRRRSRRRRRAHAPVRRGRPPGAERPACAGAGAADREEPQRAQAAARSPPTSRWRRVIRRRSCTV
jgi:hypothetical protein